MAKIIYRIELDGEGTEWPTTVDAKVFIDTGEGMKQSHLSSFSIDIDLKGGKINSLIQKRDLESLD